MADISFEKTLPYNLEAERALLGAILIDCAMPSDARPEDLYLDSHRRILIAMREINDRNERIEPVTLKNHLQMKNELEACGGAAYLASLTDGLPRIELAQQYIRIIRRAAALRRLIQMGSEVTARAYADEQDPAEIVSAALEACDEASAITNEDAGLIHVSELVSPVFNEIEQRFNNKQTDAWATGFIDLDRMLTGGIRKKNMMIIAGRPGMGKTACITNMLVNMATAGTNCAFFSLEMGADQIVERILSFMSNVEASRLRTGFLNKENWSALSAAAGILSELPLWIDDSTNLSVGDLRSRIRKVRPRHKNGVDEGKIDIVAVDYLQLMNPPERMRKNADETAQVTAISKGLKNMAKSMDIGVIPLSQLSRASERRTDRRPQLSDLRQSGAIEQDADIVMFVHREEMGSPTEENAGVASFIIGKQRNGPTGEITVTYNKHITCFRSVYSE